MKVVITLLVSVVLSVNATAAPVQYAVDGLAIGTQLNFGSAPDREYKCSPSEQFGGLTWCQKTRAYKERRKPYTAAYSLLHSRDGKIAYVNRSQEPGFSNSNEAEEDIQRYSRKIGESPRIMKMPRRSGLTDGLIAIWSQITLVQLDEESVKILSDGRRPKKGLPIDFLGNFVRVAQTAADEARLVAEAARSEMEQTRAAEKATPHVRIAQLELDRAATDGKNHHRESILYGSTGGLLIMLIGSTIGVFLKQQKARNSATNPIEVSTQSQSSATEMEEFVSSPAIAIAEDAFGRELEEQVGALNAATQESRSNATETVPGTA